MDNDGNNTKAEIIAAAKSVLGECAEEELSAVCAHILKQLNSFEILKKVDTTCVEPAFGVFDDDIYKAEKIG